MVLPRSQWETSHRPMRAEKSKQKGIDFFPFALCLRRPSGGACAELLASLDNMGVPGPPIWRLWLRFRRF